MRRTPQPGIRTRVNDSRQSKPATISFPSGSGSCEGLFFDAGSEVCVIMAPGFGGTIETGLPSTAERFFREGYSVLVFDYRHWGRSSGEPRQLLSVRRQLQDCSAAVEFMRRGGGNPVRHIVLFGTSFSGGHVLVTAARDPGIAAVIAQCPMVDGLAALRNLIGYAGWRSVARIIGHGVRDAFHAVAGLSPWLVPIVGPPGTVAAMSSEDAVSGHAAIAPDDWRNEVAARIGLTVASYRPVRHVGRVACPILFAVCLQDRLAPVEPVERCIALAGERATVKRYPIGHFDIYQGAAFERAVGDQIAFLKRLPIQKISR